MENFPLNILTFPVWWYSTGLGLIWSWFNKKNHYFLEKTGLVLFARHMFEPLYQDYTKTGQILSFFIRIFVLIFKSIQFLFSFIYYALGVLIYALSLPTVIVMIIFQIFQYL